MSEEHLLKPPPTKEDVSDKARLLAPVFKQLITLDASAIGLVVIFKANFVSEDAFLNAAVALALLAFLGSLVASFMLFFKTSLLQKPKEGESLFEDPGDIPIFWVSFMGFMTGVLCLMVVAWFNFMNAMPWWLPGVLGLGMIGYAGVVLAKRLRKMRPPATSKIASK